MLFREHKSTKSESLETLVGLKGYNELVLHVNKLLNPFGITVKHLKIKNYTDELDIVLLEDYGVVGFIEK